MSKHTLNSLSLVAILALAVFVVAFALLLFVGDYRILASFFLAFLIALLSAIVLFFGMGSSSAPYSGAKPAVASGTTAASAPKTDDKSEADAAAAKAAEQKAKEEAAAKKAADEAAAKKAEDDAAAKAAEAEASARSAEEEAARKAAEEKDAARLAAEEARAAREASATASAATSTTASGDLGEDYDGDGVKEGTDEGTRPAGIDAPRDGQADDLKQIKGIGPKLEKLCNSLGFWHFDQVAAWTDDEVAWVDANLTGFKGRVSRDEWVKQAAILAGGGETDFSKRVEDGDVY